MNWRWISFLVLILKAAAQSQPPDDAIFRTTTKLVQVSVVALDKQGHPVADLRRDEFQILDNGAPQQIRLFVAETAKPVPGQPETKATNVFTNQIASPGRSSSGYSVILIDNLFTPFGDPAKETGGTALARLQALKTLQSIPAGESIAIYAIGRRLRVIGEFTSDRDLLEQQLKAWTPGVDTDSSDSILGNGTGRGGATEKFQAEAARIDALQRVSSNNVAMDALAEHLAGIPGRKNLIWLSIHFVISGRSVQKFNSAGVSIYPVDLDGVCYPPAVPCTWPRPKELMDGIAAQTGGVAFYGRNDIDIAIREAINDGHVSYTLGFYQPGEDKRATVHQLGVQINHGGVTLRYRTSYESEPPARTASRSPAADLLKAMNRPIDAAGIGLTASATRTRDRIDLSVSFDISGLDLAQNGGLWKGSAELVARFMTSDGVQAGDVLAEKLTFNLRPATYASMLQSGAPLHKEIRIPAKAATLKLLVGSLTSGKIGALTIPLSKIGPSATKQK